jgi:hypothetical protein
MHGSDLSCELCLSHRDQYFPTKLNQPDYSKPDALIRPFFSPVQTSVSVDDYLAKHKPDTTSILEFLSYVDEPATNIHFSTAQLSCVINTMESRDGSLCLQEMNPNQLCGEYVDVSTLSTTTVSIKSRPLKKAKLQDLTPEEREERRRSQNREHQRRYRERKTFRQWALRCK